MNESVIRQPPRARGDDKRLQNGRRVGDRALPRREGPSRRRRYRSRRRLRSRAARHIHARAGRHEERRAQRGPHMWTHTSRTATAAPRFPPSGSRPLGHSARCQESARTSWCRWPPGPIRPARCGFQPLTALENSQHPDPAELERAYELRRRNDVELSLLFRGIDVLVTPTLFC
jgi:hypothetical protein